MNTVTQRPLCSFAQQLMDKFGKESLCYDPRQKYEDCDGECRWGSNCDECGKPRVWSNDMCASFLLCLNPNCTMDK